MTAKIKLKHSGGNLIINGDMQVAQRGTSSTGTTGYNTVDRFKYVDTSTDEVPTQAQVDVAAGTTPYTLGFRKAYKITNGNQTSGAQAATRVRFGQDIEAQNIAQSGWNNKSTSSFITLSFWVKSSVAQNFYGHTKSHGGTQQNYAFETGSLTADTWTKITKTIPGAANVDFATTVDTGLELRIDPFVGTNYTDNSVTLNQWYQNDGTKIHPDMPSTWYTTNDATFEITGVQLEVGSTATDFEHRSIAEELALCQRYLAPQIQVLLILEIW
jgi:hypothetical protein